MHKLIHNSARIDRLFHYMLGYQLYKFLELYRELRKVNPKHAARVLKQYRKRRPWLSLRIEDEFYHVSSPGLGGAGRISICSRSRSEFIYMCAHLISAIKQRTGEKWDFWEYNERRRTQQLVYFYALKPRVGRLTGGHNLKGGTK